MTAYSLLREKILDVLDSLTERERNVLSLRFWSQGRLQPNPRRSW